MDSNKIKKDVLTYQKIPVISKQTGTGLINKAGN